MPAGFASTPEPPYYAVIFTAGDHGYEATAQAMFELALKQPGCLGAESVRGDNGLGITVAYFTDEPAIRAWKQNSEHLVAQRLGKERWYSHYELRVAKVERAYSGPELSRPTRQSAKGSARNPVVASDRASFRNRQQ